MSKFGIYSLESFGLNQRIQQQQHAVQQVQAGWREAVVRLIEASLMEQEEN